MSLGVRWLSVVCQSHPIPVVKPLAVHSSHRAGTAAVYVSMNKLQSKGICDYSNAESDDTGSIDAR